MSVQTCANSCRHIITYLGWVPCFTGPPGLNHMLARFYAQQLGARNLRRNLHEKPGGVLTGKRESGSGSIGGRDPALAYKKGCVKPGLFDDPAAEVVTSADAVLHTHSAHKQTKARCTTNQGALDDKPRRVGGVLAYKYTLIALTPFIRRHRALDREKVGSDPRVVTGRPRARPHYGHGRRPHSKRGTVSATPRRFQKITPDATTASSRRLQLYEGAGARCFRKRSNSPPAHRSDAQCLYLLRCVRRAARMRWMDA